MEAGLLSKSKAKQIIQSFWLGKKKKRLEIKCLKWEMMFTASPAMVSQRETQQYILRTKNNLYSLI